MTFNNLNTNQINIIGNSRTLDYVIRRELDIIEGDAKYKETVTDRKHNKWDQHNIRRDTLTLIHMGGGPKSFCHNSHHCI